jgi:hypothetical protein
VNGIIRAGPHHVGDEAGSAQRRQGVSAAAQRPIHRFRLSRSVSTSAARRIDSGALSARFANAPNWIPQ